MSHKILMVEDDFALAMGTEYALKSEGYEVVKAGNLETARKLLAPDIDLVLLDVMLPDGMGYNLCREIREEGNTVPIIFLTAMSEEINIVQGLETGADDYIAKPYRVKELLSRITANIRRNELVKAREKQTGDYNHYEDGIVFGTHIFYPKEMKLKKSEETVECTLSEIKLLSKLIYNRGNVLTRSSLMQELYDTGEMFIDDNTLSVYMKRLRDKLGEDAVYIETVRGVGYTFRK